MFMITITSMGIALGRSEMLIVKFQNDRTGNERYGNYDVKVYVNNKLIAVDRIEDYKRRCGWRGLVKLLGEKENEGGKE